MPVYKDRFVSLWCLGESNRGSVELMDPSQTSLAGICSFLSAVIVLFVHFGIYDFVSVGRL